MGGLGYYQEKFGPFPNPPTPTPSGMSEGAIKMIKKVIIADAGALSASFLTMGTVLSISTVVPAATAAILTELAIAAAWSSLMGSLIG